MTIMVTGGASYIGSLSVFFPCYNDAPTIAGLVLHEARRIPEVGQVFVFHGFRFDCFG